jgi:hypothetical protein
MVKAAPVKKWSDDRLEPCSREIFSTSHDESLAKRAFSLNIP